MADGLEGSVKELLVEFGSIDNRLDLNFGEPIAVGILFEPDLTEFGGIRRQFGERASGQV